MVDVWSLVGKRTMLTPVSFLLLVVSVIVSIASGENSMDTVRRTLPAYTVALNAETTLNSSACRRELGVFRAAVDISKLWALKVLDSSGQPKPGFMYGNNYWLGSRAQCFEADNKNPLQLRQAFLRNASRFRETEDEFPPYKLNYFVAHIRHNSTLQYHVNIPNEDMVTLGLCLPAACTTDQLRSILKNIFQERTLMITELYRTDFKLENVSDLQDDHMWLLNGRIMLVLFILVITLFLMIAATAYDVLVYQKYLRVKTQIRDTCENDTWNACKFSNDIPESVAPVRMKRPNVLGEVLVCFSIYTNTKIIFGTKLGAGEIGPIHGLRFFAMAWIIVLHTSFFILDFAENKPWIWRLAEGFVEQTLSNGTVTVDTFFFIGGFLMALVQFKQNLKSTTKDETVSYQAKVLEFFVTVLKRFVRLTPAYMMTIGLFVITSAWYDQTSLFVTFERTQETCAKYWWRNLLYIHNFFSDKDMCLSWSWYLSADMQYYVMGTFLVTLSSIYFYTAATILLVIFLSSTVLTGYISYITEYVPTIDGQYRTMSVLYDPPWTRVGPYIVGIVTAYIFIRLNNKLTLERRHTVVLWLLGSACNLVVLFGMWNKQISLVSAALYVALSRTLWGIGIAWILIACSTNHGGIVNTILTFKIWIPLSRLSYCAYLLNVFVIRSVNLRSEFSTHLDLLPLVVIFLGNLMTTYLCSYVLSLMMEVPFLRIVKLFVKSRTQHRLSKNQPKNMIEIK